MEIRYYRCAGTKAPTMIEDSEDREITEDKQEVVVFMVPNVSHLVPTEAEWEKLKEINSEKLKKLVAPPEAAKTEEAAEVEESKKEESEDAPMETSQAAPADTSLDESQSQEVADSATGEPTHYSKLDANSLKVRLFYSKIIWTGH